MDIQEIKNFARNKIESDDLARQVRRRIKETTWEKQNMREGFSETFKPLISQFEKPEDTKTRNIFTQNQEMLKNQLALTEGLRDNQRAITQGFNQLERLADMQELPPPGDDNQEQSGTKQSRTTPKLYDIEKNSDTQDRETLSYLGYPRPNDFFITKPTRLQEIYDEVTNDKNVMGNRIGALKSTKNKTEADKEELNFYKIQHGILSKYRNILNLYLASLDLQVGQGIYYSPQELLKRLELLCGSLAAGNNGVLSEYIQIAHRLRDLGVINNNKLNALFKKYINMR